jgi:uncharacterized protein
MNYHINMEFEWDEIKSSACYEERGFDFAYVLHVFLDPDRLVRKDHRWDYGEDRFELTGVIDGRVFVLIYTVRSTRIRIISARKANRREVKDYEKNARQN